MVIFLLFFGIAFLGPIVIPLFYWYVLKKRVSSVFNVSRKIRRFWAILFVAQVGLQFLKAYKLPQGTAVNVPEFLGGVMGGIIMALLLWKTWKQEENPSRDEVT